MTADNQTGHNYYTSPSGNDSNDGSAEHPFRTIQHAADVMVAGDICFVREGTYRVTVRLNRSGADGMPIRFVAYPGEVATLSGTEPVSGEWAIHEGEIFKTQIGQPFEQLFVDGQMMSEARWPKAAPEDYLDRSRWATTSPGSSYGRIVDPELSETDIDWTGAVAVLNIGHQYLSWMRIVRNHSAGNDTFEYDRDLEYLGDFVNRLDHPTDWVGQKYQLIGCLAGLTVPGEWYLDQEMMMLYLWPPEGCDLSNCAIEVKSREHAFEAEGVEHIHIEGFHFFGTTFRFENSRNCVVDGCHLRYPNYNRYISDPLIDPRNHPCSFTSGSDNTVKNSSLAHSQSYGFVMMGSEHTCENNLIHDFGWTGTMCPGLVMCPTDLYPTGGEELEDDGALARFNTIYDAGNLCVDFQGQPNAIAEYNHIYDGGKCCHDVALLYTLYSTAAGTVFRFNWVHGVHTPEIAIGIRCDYQAREVSFHHNVAWDCGWEGILLWGDRNKVCNNTTLDNGITDILIWRRPEPDMPYMQQWPPLLEVQNENTFCANNVSQRITAGRSAHHGTTLSCKMSNNYQGDAPMLEDMENYDFRPKAGSPLIDAGVKVPGITDGHLGKAPDIGAYEYGGEHWIPGCRNSLWILPSESKSTSGQVELRVLLSLPPFEATNVTINGQTLIFDADNWWRPQSPGLPAAEVRITIDPSNTEITADLSAMDSVFGIRHPFVMLPLGS